MKKAILFALLVSTATAIAESPVSIKSDKGFYIGGGVGASRYSITLNNSTYDYSDPDNPTLIFNCYAIKTESKYET